jgi:hypothetical protein
VVNSCMDYCCMLLTNFQLFPSPSHAVQPLTLHPLVNIVTDAVISHILNFLHFKELVHV